MTQADIEIWENAVRQSITRGVLEAAMIMRGFDRAYANPEKAWIEYVDNACALHVDAQHKQYIDMGYLMNFALMPEVGLKQMFPGKYDD